MNRIKSIIQKGNIKYFIVGIIAILLFLLAINYFKITDLEMLSITKYSDKMTPYMDILEKDDLDHYVCYTLTYYQNEYHQNNVKIKDIVEFINNHFDQKVNNEQIEKIGITPYMIEQHITYNSNNNEYIITTDELSNQEIAKIPITKYKLEKIKKKRTNVYEIIYSKYEIKTPHKILNYYIHQNNQNAINEINLYLTGEKPIKYIIQYINHKNINKLGKKTKTIKLQYTIDKQHILIKRKK